MKNVELLVNIVDLYTMYCTVFLLSCTGLVIGGGEGGGEGSKIVLYHLTINLPQDATVSG